MTIQKRDENMFFIEINRLQNKLLGGLTTEKEKSISLIFWCFFPVS